MSPRRSPLNALIALTAASFGLGVVLATFAAMTGNAVPAIGLVGMGLLVLVMFGVFAGLMAMYWRRLDEAAREAHKWAWFWGGSGGMLLGAAGFALLLGRPDMPAPLWPSFEPTPNNYVATGIILVLLFLTAGYGLAWAGWWLWRGR